MVNDTASGEFDDSHPIPQSQIRKEWRKEHPNKPMPKIEGYVVPERSFVKTVQHNRKEVGREGEQKEYGRKLPISKTTGTLVKDESTNTYLILRRSNASGPVSRTVRHEIRHIAEKEGYGSEVHSRVGGGDRDAVYHHGAVKHRQNDPFTIPVFGFNPSDLFGFKEPKRR